VSDDKYKKEHQIERILLSVDQDTLRFNIPCRKLREIADYLVLDVSKIHDKNKDVLVHLIWDEILNWRYGDFWK
jgi:hypothetical protein